jgi:hypothetical protein
MMEMTVKERGMIHLIFSVIFFTHLQYIGEIFHLTVISLNFSNQRRRKKFETINNHICHHCVCLEE